MAQESRRNVHYLRIFRSNSCYSISIPEDGTVESLQSHCIHTQFHWSSGPPVCFPSWGTQVQSPGGTYVKQGFSCSRCLATLVTPIWFNHCGLVCGRFHPEPSLGRHTDNVIIPLDLTQLFCPGFTPICLSFRLHSQHSQLLGRSPVESLQSHCFHTQFH